MTEETNNDPAKKMRTLLNGGKASSPVGRLPKKKSGTVSTLPQREEEKIDEHEAAKPPLDVSHLPKPVAPASVPASKGRKLNFGPPFWTIASVISLLVNIVLIGVLLAVLSNIKKLNLEQVNLEQIKPQKLLGQGNDLLGGLYKNFEKMDRAHIISTIPVQTTIPVKFDLQLNQQTNVVLSQDVTITNARVTVNTGGLNITNALTTIVLPQGTTLPVVLNLTVPVDTTVPVVLNVNIDIPLVETQLHEPFSGLQEVVKPFYCMLNASAVNLDGQPICK